MQSLFLFFSLTVLLCNPAFLWDETPESEHPFFCTMRWFFYANDAVEKVFHYFDASWLTLVSNCKQPLSFNGSHPHLFHYHHVCTKQLTVLPKGLIHDPICGSLLLLRNHQAFSNTQQRCALSHSSEDSSSDNIMHGRLSGSTTTHP